MGLFKMILAVLETQVIRVKETHHKDTQVIRDKETHLTLVKETHHKEIQVIRDKHTTMTQDTTMNQYITMTQDTVNIKKPATQVQSQESPVQSPKNRT